MPANGMNVGVDYQITYYESTSGGLIPLGDVQSVRITAQHHPIKNARYNQPPTFAYIPDGYKIDFTITRNGAVLENLMATFEQQFNAGNVMTPGYLQETINNADGTISRFQYEKFVVFLTNHGDISREKTVTMTLEGMASKKTPIV
jgi:hypothetical protein